MAGSNLARHAVTGPDQAGEDEKAIGPEKNGSAVHDAALPDRWRLFKRVFRCI